MYEYLIRVHVKSESRLQDLGQYQRYETNL